MPKNTLSKIYIVGRGIQIWEEIMHIRKEKGEYVSLQLYLVF